MTRTFRALMFNCEMKNSMILIQKISDWLNQRLKKMKQAYYKERSNMKNFRGKKKLKTSLFLSFFDDNRTMEFLR